MLISHSNNYKYLCNCFIHVSICLDYSAKYLFAYTEISQIDALFKDFQDVAIVKLYTSCVILYRLICHKSVCFNLLYIKNCVNVNLNTGKVNTYLNKRTTILKYFDTCI